MSREQLSRVARLRAERAAARQQELESPVELAAAPLDAAALQAWDAGLQVVELPDGQQAEQDLPAGSREAGFASSRAAVHMVKLAAGRLAQARRLLPGSAFVWAKPAAPVPWP